MCYLHEEKKYIQNVLFYMFLFKKYNEISPRTSILVNFKKTKSLKLTYCTVKIHAI